MNDLLTVLFFGFFSFFGYFIYHVRVTTRMTLKMLAEERDELRRLSQALDRIADGPPRCLSCSVSPAVAGSGYCQDCRGALNRLKPKGGPVVGGSVSSTAFRS